MPGPASPRQVLQRLLDGIAQRKWHELHELYADDALVEYPFGLPAPRRLEGKAAIRDYFAVTAQLPLELRPFNIVVHETTDPEVVIVEWDYDGRVTTTGRVFRVSNIQVSRVRDGRIAASRDYHNHAAMADAFGRLVDVASALAGATRDHDSPVS